MIELDNLYRIGLIGFISASVSYSGFLFCGTEHFIREGDYYGLAIWDGLLIPLAPVYYLVFQYFRDFVRDRNETKALWKEIGFL